MNIGIVTTWFERGAAYVSRAYMDCLAGNNRVFIYVRGGEETGRGDPRWDLPNVTWGPRCLGVWRNSRSAILMSHLCKWLDSNQIDLVIFNEERNHKLVEAVADLGIAVGAYVDYYTKRMVPEFEVYDFLLCNTRRHYSVFQHHPGARFVQWGTDVDLFSPHGALTVPPADKPVTFFHSAGWIGVNCRKGTDLVIRAFAQVTGDARLVVHTQIAMDRLGEAARLVEQDPRITVVQETVPSPGLYHLGDVFVYPSRLEGIGLCVPEALACGLPVITTDNAPMNEFVTEGENGKLVKVAQWRTRADNYYWLECEVDLESLVAAMQHFVDHREELEGYKQRARRSAESRFDWQKNTRELSATLSRFLNTRRRRRPSFGETLTWKARDVFLVTQRLVYDCGKLLPKPLAHWLNAPFRLLQRSRR